MSFRATLNEYIEALGCNATELSAASGLSMSTISRYRSGEHTPAAESPQIERLAHGIALLSAEKDSATRLDEHIVLARLSNCITGSEIPHSELLRNLTELLGALGIRNSVLARALNFDPSYISRILSGQRHPNNMQAIVEQTSSYIARRCDDPAMTSALSSAIGVNASKLATARDRTVAILSWLGSNTAMPTNPLESFLHRLDGFELSEYTSVIRFDQIPLPADVPELPVCKSYFGLEEMMASELDFLAATLHSDSTSDVINYSDMPLEEMAANSEFIKKWMVGVTSLLKRGLTLHMVHDVNRPLQEMMFGLESWIPMYMTGQVHPYYLNTSQGHVFNHLLKTSGGAALVGEAIAGYQSEGKYYLTRDPQEVSHYQRRAERLLKKALPLMRIYSKGDNQSEIDELLTGVDITPAEFNNIKITMYEERTVVVTKRSEPPLHFVIEHPKMVHAFRNFIAPVVEE